MRRHKLANAAIAVALLAQTGCGSDEPKKFDVTGQLIVSGVYDMQAKARNESCLLYDRNTDIKPGVNIEITDGAGKTLAFGQFGEGGYVGSEFEGCRFPFLIVDVPGGEDVYKVKIGKRTPVPYTSEEIKKPIKITIGG
jgi:hypothetical protein